jgi:hypothetical protein
MHSKKTFIAVLLQWEKVQVDTDTGAYDYPLTILLTSIAVGHTCRPGGTARLPRRSRYEE